MSEELQDDGDIVKAMGYVTIYSSYLEEQIDSLLSLLEVVRSYEKGHQVSDKIDHCKKTLRVLNEVNFSQVISNLNVCTKLFQDRNKLTHGRIYSGLQGPDMLHSNKKGIAARPVTSSELYDLANELWLARTAIYRPMIFDVPKSIAEWGRI